MKYFNYVMLMDSLFFLRSFYKSWVSFCPVKKDLITQGKHIHKHYSSQCTATDKFNYHEECEKKVNNQINWELHASYVYLGMAYYFNRSSIALPGFTNLFLHFSEEEMEHARFLMYYQNFRGGKINLCNIKAPEINDLSPDKAVQGALNLEKEVTQYLLELHKTASEHNDPDLTQFLESSFIEEQFKSINELNNLSATIKRVGTQEGLYILDNKLQKLHKPLLKQN